MDALIAASARRLNGDCIQPRIEGAARLEVPCEWFKNRPMPKGIYARQNADVFKRFWSQVDLSGDCWIWLGAKQRRGYGRFWLNGRGYYAHRVAFFLTYGRWPQPCCLHSCDNPPCVRPDHLFEGTEKDNTQDMITKGRDGFPRKLTKEQIADIFSRPRFHGSLARLAREFHVSHSVISRLLAKTNL